MLLITLQCPSGKDKSLSSFTDQIYRLFDTSTVSIQASYTVRVHSVNDVQTLPTLARIIQDMEKEKDEDEATITHHEDELESQVVAMEKEVKAIQMETEKSRRDYMARVSNLLVEVNALSGELESVLKKIDELESVKRDQAELMKECERLEEMGVVVPEAWEMAKQVDRMEITVHGSEEKESVKSLQKSVVRAKNEASSLVKPSEVKKRPVESETPSLIKSSELKKSEKTETPSLVKPSELKNKSTATVKSPHTSPAPSSYSASLPTPITHTQPSVVKRASCPPPPIPSKPRPRSPVSRIPPPPPPSRLSTQTTRSLPASVEKEEKDERRVKSEEVEKEPEEPEEPEEMHLMKPSMMRQRMDMMNKLNGINQNRTKSVVMVPLKSQSRESAMPDLYKDFAPPMRPRKYNS